jgi:hypothetical protein
MTSKEIIDSFRANYKQQETQQRAESFRDELASQHPETPRDESVKINIDAWRNSVIGEIAVKRFPELKCFRPQRHRYANDEEFKEFDEFLAAMAAFKDHCNALQKAVERRTLETATGELQGLPSDDL